MDRFFDKSVKPMSKSANVTANVNNLKSRLSDIVEPDFGLLDQVLSLEVLSRRQLAKVRHGDKTVYERNDAMLDLLVTVEQCDKFLTALQHTGQQHVVNLIMANGGQTISQFFFKCVNLCTGRSFSYSGHCIVVIPRVLAAADF